MQDDLINLKIKPHNSQVLFKFSSLFNYLDEQFKLCGCKIKIVRI